MTTHTCLVCGAPADNLVPSRHIVGGAVIERVWMCGPCEVEDRDERERKRRE